MCHIETYAGTSIELAVVQRIVVGEKDDILATEIHAALTLRED